MENNALARINNGEDYAVALAVRAFREILGDD